MRFRCNRLSWEQSIIIGSTQSGMRSDALIHALHSPADRKNTECNPTFAYARKGFSISQGLASSRRRVTAGATRKAPVGTLRTCLACSEDWNESKGGIRSNHAMPPAA